MPNDPPHSPNLCMTAHHRLVVDMFLEGTLGIAYQSIPILTKYNHPFYGIPWDLPGVQKDLIWGSSYKGGGGSGRCSYHQISHWHHHSPLISSIREAGLWSKIQQHLLEFGCHGYRKEKRNTKMASPWIKKKLPQGPKGPYMGGGGHKWGGGIAPFGRRK